jgi:hypothetical protein
MYQFISSLTPEQLAIFAGLFTPFLHYLSTKFISFENSHRNFINWIVSFVIPAFFTLATYLSTNTSFNNLVPLYGTVYAVSQLIYLVSVRTWNNNAYLRQQLAPFISTPVVTAPVTTVVVAPVAPVQPEVIL